MSIPNSVATLIAYCFVIFVFMGVIFEFELCVTEDILGSSSADMSIGLIPTAEAILSPDFIVTGFVWDS